MSSNSQFHVQNVPSQAHSSTGKPVVFCLRPDKIPVDEKEKLKSQFVKLNPFKLQSEMVAKIKIFINKTNSIFKDAEKLKGN